LTPKVPETDFPTEMVTEGEVRVVVPKLQAYVTDRSDYAPSKAPVFYNPVMELNRDISILALQSYQRRVDRRISVCEPLTSSGVRGVRFAAEIHGVSSVIINDISHRAIRMAEQNVELNNLGKRVVVKHGDAKCLLGCHGRPRERFDVVDIDPFGSPVPYLDSAIRALRNGGLLALTATDLAPLCGVHPKACIRKYGGKPLRTEYCHELAVRLLAGCAGITAAKHDIGIRVLFSHSTDHYVRTYTEIGYGAKKADESLRNMGYILHCFNCLHRETAANPFTTRTERCPECGHIMEYAGPVWLGGIFDTGFCEALVEEKARRAFRNSARITKLLNLVKDEADAPSTYYVVDQVSGKLGLPAPSVTSVLLALREKGVLAVPTHFNSRGVRTDASAFVVQEVVRFLVE
jgi:tRNA (guanine26-N2/guanine27-N2)-dimethyltransferase